MLYRFDEKKRTRGRDMGWNLPPPWQPQISNYQTISYFLGAFSEWGMSIRHANAKAGSSN